MKDIIIGNKIIGENHPTFIVTEAGCNHEGSLDIAKKLVKQAALSGADAIKFQSYDPKKLVTKTVPYFWVEEKEGTSQLENYQKQGKLSKEEFRKVAEYAKENNIIFFSTPFDEENADFLEELNVPCYKIAATDLTNIPFLKYVAKKDKPIIFSAGMCTIGEIEEAIEAIKSTGNDQIIPLHCMVIYPTPARLANLNFIKTLQNLFPEHPIGFSDHTLGINIPAIAVSMGAKLIEKHYTIDKNLTGTPDHAMSVDPNELRSMVQNIREAEVCLGSHIRTILPEELGAHTYGRRKIVAKVDIPENSLITREMITCKRTGEGLYPKFIDIIIGKKAKTYIREDESITWDKIS